MGARRVDEAAVVDAGGTGRHAREAGQATVDVERHLGRRRPVVLQHVLDQVDAAARAIELVAEQHEGRARRRAEAAVHALAQHRFRLGDLRVGELREGKVGLHRPQFSDV